MTSILYRAKAKFEREYRDFIVRCGLDQNLRNRNKGQYKILLYHGIDHVSSLKYNHRFCSISDFTSQLQYFKKHFNLISVKDVFQKKGTKDKLNVAITFDDGYKNNVKYAVPILEKMQIPATIYVTSIRKMGATFLWADFIDIATTLQDKSLTIEGLNFKKNTLGKFVCGDIMLKNYIKEGDFKRKEIAMNAFCNVDFMDNESLFDYWKLIDETDLQVLSNSKYVSIGSHSHLHNNLGNIALEEAKQEMKISKEYIENCTQKEITSLAFPDGSYTREVIDSAERIGYKYMLATDYRYQEDKNDPRILNRYGFYAYESSNNQIHRMLRL